MDIPTPWPCANSSLWRVATARMGETATIKRSFVIGTRGSLLARAQCRIVQEELAARHSDDAWLMKEIKTQGGIDRNGSLASVGGQGSLRRTAQLLCYRPDLTVRDIRGNVDTRLRKLHEHQYDALALAAAGLVPLGRGRRV